MDMENPEIMEIPVFAFTHSYKEKSCPKEYISKEEHSERSMQNPSVADSLKLVIFF